MKLMIVESPNKTKKIQSFLGSEWRVMASVGHVRDLPEKEIGVSAPDFKPQYLPTERGAEVLARLGAAAKQAEAVYLATDPDREGEAISWHIAEALKLQNPKRVTFSEITEKAVKTAITQARNINMQLVFAQEARRVLDRFCGYLVSGPLSKAAGDKLSAGRVQSPAVRLVVEQERKIAAFKSTTHYGVELVFEAVDNITDGWKAVWKPKNWLAEGEEYFLDKTAAENIAKARNLHVLDCQESESKSGPPAPFVTASLLQAASNAMKFSSKQTMDAAQELFAQGHITYMRTDSPNFSAEFTEEARAFCEAKGWPLVCTPRKWKSKESAQEAHEAIRPTHIEVEEAGENADQKALYALIRQHSLAAMLEDALFAVRVATLEAEIDGKKAQFEAKGRTMLKPGWKTLMESDQAEDAEDQTEDAEDQAAEAENPVPALKPGAMATAMQGKLLTKKTKPVARFTEASLIRELEKRGIGRPSTYAAILENIMKHKGYVQTEKRFLVPTPLGEAVVDNLKNKFSFMNFEFTKKMEDLLDDVAEGKAAYKTVVASSYEQLQQELLAFIKDTTLPCPECGGDKLRHLVKKASKTDPKEYDFWACDTCKSTFPNEGGKPGPKQEKREKKPQELSQFKCGVKGCGKALIRRQGQRKTDGKDYDFFACSGYPACKQSYPAKNGEPDYDAPKSDKAKGAK